ncbi:PRC-barrel domain-containing protein [Rhizobium paknamense]|uniref:Sporulation protein YlmC with PRC-barrel domain n=1 Tax=Rhizobium paknamense TaxID=1206817 RepID=A0ABU0I9S9_9HYPH|nr:PRC-barrel domain-containing protein [Rhizobium paknamense]MDQ0454999.1 sporulation protein YlmC with PRC-barrel domain [Rhizobium paknamense]
MKKSLNVIAAAVLAGTTALAPMAFAQGAGTGAAGTGATGAPNTGTMGTTGSGSGNMTPATPGATGATPAAPGTTAASGTYITQQGADQLAASNFIGQNVYTSDNKSIGEVNDLILQQNGGVVAVVVGVGGFLGMGQKDVAMPMDKINVTRDGQDATKVRLTTMETADALKSAPEFKTLENQRDGSTTSSTTKQ